MLIRDILNMKGSTVYSIAPEGKVAQAVGLMVEHDIGSLLVMQEGRMTGIVTFREVLKAIDTRGGNLGDVRVGEVMVSNPICGGPEDTLDHLRQVMTDNHIRYLPVRRGEQLLGVISFHDVAKSVIKETSFENRLLKRYIENTPEADAPAK